MALHFAVRAHGRRIAAAVRRHAAPAGLGFALLLAACGSAQITDVASVSRLSAGMGDADPHEGVARAHRMPVQGIDVAHWQGEVDWDAVRGAGVQFAFIKATEGGDHIDPRFYENWQGAARAGVPRGAYHFVYWCRTATEQAIWFSRAVPRDPWALPPVLDVEWNHQSRTCPRRVSREVALEKMRVLLKEMERHTGRRPIIYTDINFHRDVLEGELQDYEFWLRSVAAEPHERYANRPWRFWQYTATGRVPGVKGDVDRNVFHGSQRDWERWLAVRVGEHMVERRGRGGRRG